MKFKLKFKVQKQKERKQKIQKKEEYKWYRIQGVPFSSLNENDRDIFLSNFSSLFSAVDSGVILIQNKIEDFQYENESFSVMRTSFFIRAKRDIPFFSSVPEEPTRAKIVEEKYDRLILDDGRIAQIAVAYFFPKILPEGFLYSTFSIVDEIVMIWKTLKKNQAMQIVDSARKRKESLILEEKTSKLEREVTSLNTLANRIMSGADLIEYYLYFIYSGKDNTESKEKYTELKDTMKFFGIEIDIPHFYQKPLYEVKTSRDSFIPFMNSIEKKYIDTDSIKPFFPFISEEIIENDGVFLGISGTGNKIIYNPYTKINYNIVILGESGSGKSMTNKVIQRRFYQIHPDWPLIGLDPENEYVKPEVARAIGAFPIEIDLKELEENGEGLGLDPMRLYHKGVLDIDEVSSLLETFYPLKPEQALQLRKYIYTYESDSIYDFINKIPDASIREILEIANVPPDKTVYSGEFDITFNRIIFGLRKIGAMSKRTMDLVSALISVYAYDQLIASHQRSGGIIFVDEAWRFSENSTVLSLFENISRRGRKYGLIFMYISQRVNDLAENPKGRTILEQSATTLLLHHDDTSFETLRQVFNLSQWELEYLKKVTKGQGLLRMKTTSGSYNVKIHVLPTKEELELFSTSPFGAI